MIKHLLITVDTDKADPLGVIPLESLAVEVVRCGDCIHSSDHRPDGSEVPHDGRFCAVTKLTWETEFFCRLGKRREDAWHWLSA